MSALPSFRHERLAALSLPGTVWFGSRPVDPPRRFGTGIAALDEALGGGVPRGGVSEITGAPSSGRTALLCLLLAAATRAGEATAVVDLPDALDPESLRLVGADLGRVLWVRPPSLRAGLQCADAVLAAGGFGLLALDLCVPGAARLPPAVWTRLARGAERAGSALVVLAPHRVVGHVAATSVALERRQAHWSCGAWRLFDGLAARALVARNRGMATGRTAALGLTMRARRGP